MARKQKPPGMDHWTWEEIRCGRRMSKGEKRIRRMSKNFGATEGKGSKMEHTPESFLACLAVGIVTVVVIVFFPEGCAHK
jgi:hypothetical protein